jgi:hypothetical protein
MPVEIRVTGSPEAIAAKLNGTRTRVLAALSDALYGQMVELRTYIQAEKLSGQVLKNRTGNLRRAVFESIAATASDRFEGAVSVGSEALYGAYQEYGAHIPERVPVRERVLHWIGADGANVFAMRARAFDLPARPFMRPSLDENKDKIIRALAETIDREMKA